MIGHLGCCSRRDWLFPRGDYSWHGTTPGPWHRRGLEKPVLSTCTWGHHHIYTTIGDACVCVCVCAQFDQFLPVRSHFDTKRPVNFFHIATFPSPTFGPLFAFHCPLFFTKNNNLHAAMFWKVTVTTQDRLLNRKHLRPLARVVHWWGVRLRS